MQSINSILVPVDFTPLAEASYRYALQLADDLSAAVHVIHCIPVAPAPAGAGGVVIDVTPELYTQAETDLQLFIEAGLDDFTSAHGRSPAVDGVVSFLNLRRAVREYVDEYAVDLVVVGTHGVRDNWDRLFGTNAAFLVGNTGTSVLIVPEGTGYQPFKSVCFATDLREDDFTGVKHLRESLSVFDSRISFLHVQRPAGGQTPEGLSLLKQTFLHIEEGMDASFNTVWHEDVTAGIFSWLADNPHDLLVMVKPHRNWWDRTFRHSETKESAGIARLPLLILEPEA